MPLNLPKKLLAAFSILLGLMFLASTDALAATFSLSPASGSTVSGTFDVTINLSELSGKQVSGVDIYLNYEPEKLEAQEISTTNGIFTSYPLKTIDSTSGKIAIGASASAFSPVTTEGAIATITFKALATSGSTTLSFDYTEGSTTDSNITEAGTATDILTQPPTVTYNFGTTTTPSTTTSTPKGGAPSASPSGTPAGGFIEPTVFISLLSLTLISLGIMLKVKTRTALTFEQKVLKNL